MLISCTSCNSKYLVNSADLKPDGRTVECANCGNQWYQESALSEEEILTLSAPSTTEIKNQQKEKNKPIPNLPSTIVKEQKVSAINSILVLLFLTALVFGFWMMRDLNLNSLVLFKFYIDEFYFNLKLIFNDIAKIIHQIINSF